MILYAISTFFPGRTFVVLVKPTDTVARIRAQLLHYLYAIGLDDHQFRLVYKDTFLKDAHNIEDYEILPSSVLVMDAVSNRYESVTNIRSLSSSMPKEDLATQRQHAQIKQAMDDEISVFKKREFMTDLFRVFNYIHLILTCLCVFTTYWYSFFWHFVLFMFVHLCWPYYNRLTGFIGPYSLHKNQLCIAYIVIALIFMLGNVVMEFFEVQKVAIYGCSATTYVDKCSVSVVFSAVLYLAHALFLTAMVSLCSALMKNYHVGVGDYMEGYLVQTRDIMKVLQFAASRNVKERRIAAFELATLSASGDDNKFRIVAEGGLPLIIAMSLDRDPLVQEHAVEALAELLVIPAIQTSLAQSGGLTALTTLLRTAPHEEQGGRDRARTQKLVRDVAVALSYIVSDSPHLQETVIEGRGLEDLCYGARHGPAAAQKILAGIFLELALNASLRAHLLDQWETQTAPALLALCQVRDTVADLRTSRGSTGVMNPSDEARRLALQCFELFALDNPARVILQPSLLDLLLQLPLRTVDDRFYILAGKLLLYYAEDEEAAQQLVSHRSVEVALDRYARSSDPVLQKVVVKIIFCLLERPTTRHAAKGMALGEILRRIRDRPQDTEAAEMAEQGLQLLRTDDTLIGLPSGSMMDKVLHDQLDARVDEMRTKFGSRASLHSSDSDPPPSYTSQDPKKKK